MASIDEMAMEYVLAVRNDMDPDDDTYVATFRILTKMIKLFGIDETNRHLDAARQTYKIIITD